jgi:hypothetical protein
MSSVKRLALAIVQFLAEQKQYGNLSPDAQVDLTPNFHVLKF